MPLGNAEVGASQYYHQHAESLARKLPLRSLRPFPRVKGKDDGGLRLGQGWEQGIGARYMVPI